jgi:hypothetical protein
VTGERVKSRPDKGRPLSPARFLPLLLAAADDTRIEPQAGVVDEDPTVDLSDVDLGDAAFDDVFRGAREIERDLEVFREVIERAERQHPEHLVALRHDRSDRTDAAVAAARDDDLALSEGGPPGEIDELLRVSRDADIRLRADGTKRLPDARGRFAIARAFGGEVENDRHGVRIARRESFSTRGARLRPVPLSGDTGHF